MKRLAIFLTTAFALVLYAFSEEFRIDYQDTSGKPYSLGFRTCEWDDNEVELIDITINDNIETLSLPSSVSHSGIEYALVSLYYSVTSNGFSINKIIIPSSVEVIKNKALGASEIIIDDAPIIQILGFAYENDGLKSFSFGNNCRLSELPWGCFEGCGSLETVQLPESLSSLGVMTFRGCKSLKSVNLPTVMNYVPSGTFMGCESLEEIEIPDNYIFIGTSAFSGCSSLHDVTLPSMLKVIDNGAFFGCSSLENVSLPEGVTELRTSTFRGCESLKSITATSNLTSIGSGAFQGCASLTEAPLTDALTTIEDDSFRGCESLENLVIPGSVTSVGINAFADCSGLKSVTVGDGVKGIGQWAFYDCTAMTDLTLGKSLESIGAEAFDGDINIRHIECRSPEPPDFPGGFPEEVCEKAIVTVPEGSEEAYNSDPVWDPMVEGESPVIKAQYIELNVYELELKPGESFTLVATVYPEDTADKTVTWKSDDYSIVQVNYFGRVYAPERFGYYGETLVTAECGDASICCEVKVSETGSVDSIFTDADAKADIYDLSGTLLRSGCSREDLQTLAPGVYILKSGSAIRKIVI